MAVACVDFPRLALMQLVRAQATVISWCPYAILAACTLGLLAWKWVFHWQKKKRHFQLWALDKKPVFVYRFWKHVLHYLLKLVSFLSHRAALRKEKDTIDSQSTPQIKPSSTWLHCHWEKVILPCKKKISFSYYWSALISQNSCGLCWASSTTAFLIGRMHSYFRDWKVILTEVYQVCSCLFSDTMEIHSFSLPQYKMSVFCLTAYSPAASTLYLWLLLDQALILVTRRTTWKLFLYAVFI